MSKLKKMLLICIVLVLFAGLIYHFRMFFLSQIIEPIALVIWTFWNLLCSIDQRLLWGGVIAACVIIMFLMIPSSGDILTNPVYNYDFRPQGQIDYWQGIIEHGDDDRLRNELRSLLWKVLIQANLSQVSESEDVIIADTPLPAETREYLADKKRNQGFMKRPTWESVKSIFARIFPGWGGKKSKREIQKIKEIIQYLETELDISYEK